MDRISLFSRDTRFRWRLSLLATTTALAAGCTLITDVDRKKIPQSPVVAPDPVLDAGTAADGGTPPDATGDVVTSDAGTDAAPGDTDLGDAGSTELADAQADGG
jgi:hypothetical protein